MVFRRFHLLRPPVAYTRRVSIRKMAVEYGAPLALYYFITNEMLVCVITYLLHYNYFGKEDLIGFLESLGASKYIDLKSIECKNWAFFNDRLVISARLLANFTAASVFMSLWTPVQIPICIATFPYLRRAAQRVLRKRPTQAMN